MCIEWVDSCVSVSQKKTWEMEPEMPKHWSIEMFYLSVNEQQGRVRVQSQMQLIILYLVVGFYRGAG